MVPLTCYTMAVSGGFVNEIQSSLYLAQGLIVDLNSAPPATVLESSIPLCTDSIQGYPQQDGDCREKHHNLTSLLRKSVKELPQTVFIENVISLSNGCTEAIQEVRDELVHLAKQIPECPTTSSISRRKGRNESYSDFNKRLATDCYKLLQFIEGASQAEISNVFRPQNGPECVHSAVQTKASVTSLDIAAGVNARIQKLNEQTGNIESDVVLLKTQIQKMATDKEDKRREVQAKNNQKESEIRQSIKDIIATVNTGSEERNSLKTLIYRSSEQNEHNSEQHASYTTDLGR